MAWRSHGTTNADLVEQLSNNGLIRSERVKAAMLKVDRGDYSRAEPYQDSPQPIGFRATISAPHMHAQACESLLQYLRPGATVLDVGSGSGYLTHVIAELVQPGGIVIGLEHIQALADLGHANTSKSPEGKSLLSQGTIRYVKGDGRKGWTGSGGEDGFDAIHVGAAAPSWPQPLIEQLKSPGAMFIPVEENGLQHIYMVDKDAHGVVTKKKLMGVRYVPLTDAPPGE